MTTRRKIVFGIVGFYLLSLVLVVAIFGFTRRDNEEFAPQNEFKLDPWIELGPFDILSIPVGAWRRIEAFFGEHLRRDGPPPSS